MKIDIKYSGNIINLPASVADFVERATKNDLAVIISLAKNMAYASSFENYIADFAKNLGMSVDEVKKSLVFWSECAVISVDSFDSLVTDMVTDNPTLSNALPSYTGEQIAKFVERNKDMASLFYNCQSIMGKVFNAHDHNNIIYLKNFYKFDDEFILLLLAHCVEVGKPNWAYVRKTAANLYDQGIDTYDKLEAHFADRKNKRSLEYKIRKLFSIGEREFSKSEKEVIGKWISADISIKLLEKAYDITVDKTSKASVKYAAKIIDNWLSVGITTPEQADEAEKKYKEKQSASTFKTDDFFEAALKRSYGAKKNDTEGKK